MKLPNLREAAACQSCRHGIVSQAWSRLATFCRLGYREVDLWAVCDLYWAAGHAPAPDQPLIGDSPLHPVD